MAEKTLNTRIMLKYDSYSNWTTNNPILLAGEVAFATITSGDTQEVNSVAAPQVLIKVGDGVSRYMALPFVSAKAADVYSYAKKPEAEFIAWVKGLVDVSDIDLTGYATETFATNAAATVKSELLTTLEGYATKAELEAVDALADQGIADAAAALAAAQAAQGEVDVLETVVADYKTEVGNTYATKAELEAVDALADQGIADAATAQAKAEEVEGKLADYYKKTETYSSTEIDNKVATINGANDALAERVTDAEAAITTLNGNDTVEGSVDKKVKDAINEFATTATADDTINTFKEIVDYIGTHGGEAAEMAAAITTLEGEMDTAQGDIAGLNAAVATKAEAADLDALEGTVSDMDAAYKAADATVKSEAAADATSKANAAEAAAKAYADGLAGNYDAAGSAAAAETAAKAYADGLAGNYDAAGSAKAVQDDLDAYKESNDDAVEAIDGRVSAIEADYLKAADTYIFNCGNSFNIPDPTPAE